MRINDLIFLYRLNLQQIKSILFSKFQNAPYLVTVKVFLCTGKKLSQMKNWNDQVICWIIKNQNLPRQIFWLTEDFLRDKKIIKEKKFYLGIEIILFFSFINDLILNDKKICPRRGSNSRPRHSFKQILYL